jgi:hypothetical protein
MGLPAQGHAQFLAQFAEAQCVRFFSLFSAGEHHGECTEVKETPDPNKPTLDTPLHARTATLRGSVRQLANAD